MYPELTQEAVAEFGFGGFCICGAKAVVAALKEALEESQLPFRVDLFVWDEIPARFRDNIQRAYVILVNTRSS
ncbi:MAG: hypothetical protein JSR32_00715 [Proteobacteria bacterium]|nr:hypothetical protein [Pseudomonadota bacterium]